MKFGKRKHRGTLKRSLETSIEITFAEFYDKTQTDNWEYYGYDSRCKQFLWLNTKAPFGEYENHYEWYYIQKED